MLDDDAFNAELDRKTALQRWGLPAGGAVFVVAAGLSIVYLLKGHSGPAARPHNEPHITQVQLPPPPPPPPPPRTPPPKKPEEAPKQREPTPQKAISKPAPKAPSPPAAVTTSIQGSGPGSLAAGNGGGGDCIGAGCGSGDGAGGDDDAYYSSLVSRQLKAVLTEDERLRFARYQLTILFSLDATGHLANARVANFSGDQDVRAEVERAIRSASTGDTPAASIVGRQFTVRIIERARG